MLWHIDIQIPTDTLKYQGCLEEPKLAILAHCAAPPTYSSHTGPQQQQQHAYIKAFLQDRLPSQATHLVATLWHRCRRLGHHLFHLIHHAIPSNTWARLIVSRLRFKIHEYSAENPTHKFCYFWFLCTKKSHLLIRRIVSRPLLSSFLLRPPKILQPSCPADLPEIVPAVNFWYIEKHFLSILRGVRFLLKHWDA